MTERLRTTGCRGGCRCGRSLLRLLRGACGSSLLWLSRSACGLLPLLLLRRPLPCLLRSLRDEAFLLVDLLLLLSLLVELLLLLLLLLELLLRLGLSDDSRRCRWCAALPLLALLLVLRPRLMPGTSCFDAAWGTGCLDAAGGLGAA